MYIPTPERLVDKLMALIEDAQNVSRKLRQGGNEHAADHVANSLQHLREAARHINLSLNCKRGA